jgi:hypothetical protein
MLLLRDAAELLAGEVFALSNQHWDELPDLKKKKVILASQLQNLGSAHGRAEREPSESIRVKSLIADLEIQSREKIAGQCELIEKQIVALQELHQFLQESLNVSFQKFLGPAPSR